MVAPAIKLEILPAGFGDCLLVSCPVGDRTWRMLVDTGPDETYPALRQRLSTIPPDDQGRRHIDLFVVTHIDHDHIGGAKLLLDDRDLGLTFGDIWFNAPPRRRVRGVAEGESLAKILGAEDEDLPWNRTWGDRPVATPAGSGGIVVARPGGPKLTVLSPTPQQLDALYAVWAKELEKLRRKERDAADDEAEPRRTRAGLDLEALARKPTPLDRAVPNGSSIAILLEHQGASVLLSADAFSDVLVPELRALAQRRGEAVLEVDVLKLSHHGSRANVTLELMDALRARHYVVSTNNAYFKHPNAEAMARVITTADSPVIWFNHDTPSNRQWADAALMARYGYEVRYPQGDAQGVTIELASKIGSDSRSPRRGA